MSLKHFWTKKTLVGLGLGQFLSLLITSTGFSSSELSNRGINAPTSQSFLNYVLLTVVYGSVMLYKRQALKAKWYYYVVLGLVDVEANYLGQTLKFNQVYFMCSGEGIPVHIYNECNAA